MFIYYSLMIGVTLLALIVLCILVQENDRLKRKDKRLLYLTYMLIAASALAEWLGRLLDGKPEYPGWLLMTVKCADYILTPIAGVTLVGQMRLRNRWFKVLLIVLAFNAVFQLVSLFDGWMVTINAEGHYVHGPLYGVYIGIYLLVIGLVGVEFALYGKRFRRENRLSLYAILALVVIGIAIQELGGSEYRTVYVSLAFGAALMYIHSTEFSQLAADDFAASQRLQLMTDPLTGLRSRLSYMQDLDRIDSKERLPVNFAAFMIDLNGLKYINDTLGHEAGDELICGAAECVRRVFGSTGRCYRTGGDEFVVLAAMSRELARTELDQLEKETAAWKGDHVNALSVSCAFAHEADHPGLNCKQLIQQADMMMYEAKEVYYRRSGHDRRRRQMN